MVIGAIAMVGNANLIGVGTIVAGVVGKGTAWGSSVGLSLISLPLDLSPSEFDIRSGAVVIVVGTTGASPLQL